MKQPPRVVIAIRVSSEKQVTEGLGHLAQLSELPKLVKAAGWVLAKRPDGTDAIYDEGFASTTPTDPEETSLVHRPVFQALLSELEFTQPTYVVCRQLDRLRRDDYEHAYIVKMLRANDVTGFVEAPLLTHLETPRNIADARDAAMATIEAAFSNLQKADTKIKLMMGRRTRAYTKRKPNGGAAPYGYKWREKKQPLVIHTAEADVYKQMVSLVMDQSPAWGPAKIAHELVRRGIPTRSGRPEWTATTVRRILLSKAPCGYMKVAFTGDKEGERWVVAEGQTPIISETEWERLQAVLRQRTRESGHNQKSHALAGLLECEACGKTLKAHPDRRKAKDGKRYINYSCKVYNSGCKAGYSISERKALRELAGWVNTLLAAQDEAGWRDDLTTAGTNDIGLLETRVSNLTDEVARRRGARDRAMNALIDADDIDRDVFKAAYEDRRNALARAETELRAAEDAYAAAQTSPEPLDASVEELREVLAGWEDFPDNEKRMTLEAVIDRAILGSRSQSPRLRVIAAGSDEARRLAEARRARRSRRRKASEDAEADPA